MKPKAHYDDREEIHLFIRLVFKQGFTHLTPPQININLPFPLCRRVVLPLCLLLCRNINTGVQRAAVSLKQTKAVFPRVCLAVK